MKDCLFCRIIAGDIPSVKIWEDDNYLAILDVNPNREGATLVMPKKHNDSNYLDFTDDFMGEFTIAGKKVANLLKEGLGVERVFFVIEGLGVNHAHIKLYPAYGGGEGHLTTELGPQKSQDELQKVANKIKNS